MESLTGWMCILFVGFTLVPATLLSQASRNHSLHFYCDGSTPAKVENDWMHKISEDLMLKRKTLNVIVSKRHELFLSVPDVANKTDYLESFPNRFSLVYRLTHGWPLLSTLISVNFGYDTRQLHIPVDFRRLYDSALQILVRLQETYNLSTESMSRGEMEGSYPYTSMNAAAIKDVALFYHRLGNPWRAEDWLLEALDRADSDNSVSRKTILEYLHIVNCYIVDLRNSTGILTKLLQEYPSFAVDKNLQDDYNSIANSSCLSLNYRLNYAFEDDITAPHYTFNQANLCKPEVYKPPYLLDPNLRCRLVHYNKLHLRLAPFKMEELNIDPPILLFHDVIHNGEIETIKKIYKSKTRPALNDYGGSQKDRYFDTQYNTWLLNSTDPLTRMINLRTSAVCNADLFRSEPPMVASYGLGGEIKLHYDLIPDEKYLFNDRRTRPDYVSFVIYLNDVTEGGYTIFPYLDIAVVPVQGAALMWYNRLPDWSRDTHTHHSGCPVLRGSKWIVNKWFHVRGQHYPPCYPGGEKTREYYYLPDVL